MIVSKNAVTIDFFIEYFSTSLFLLKQANVRFFQEIIKLKTLVSVKVPFYLIFIGLNIKFTLLNLEKGNLYITFALYLKECFSEID